MNDWMKIILALAILMLVMFTEVLFLKKGLNSTAV